jgi:hypothetical protein
MPLTVVPSPVTLALVLAVSLWSLPLLAATVYKSVDENGVVSYSDTRPEEDVDVETLVIEVQDPALTETEQQRLEAMRETTDRMAADRMAREQQRAELRQQRAREQAVQAPPTYIIESGGYPIYYPYPVRRPGWNRPYPTHPIARPPLRPSRPVPYSGGQDYPASLVRKGYSPPVRAAFEK